MLQDYKRAWAKAPYAPVFVTVDALLRCRAKGQDQVLLIQRGHAPGQGLWALPGGFLEQRDGLWQSCMRELREETCSSISEADLLAALQAVQVFDHPDRSLRGRTITHVHYLDLGVQPSLPQYRARTTQPWPAGCRLPTCPSWKPSSSRTISRSCASSCP